MTYTEITKEIFTDSETVNKLLHDYDFYTSEIERKNKLCVVAGFAPLLLFMFVAFINEFYRHPLLMNIGYLSVATFFVFSLFLSLNTVNGHEFNKLKELDASFADRLNDSAFIEDISKLAVDKDSEALVKDIAKTPSTVAVLYMLLGKYFQSKNTVVA